MLRKLLALGLLAQQAPAGEGEGGASGNAEGANETTEETPNDSAPDTPEGGATPPESDPKPSGLTDAERRELEALKAYKAKQEERERERKRESMSEAERLRADLEEARRKEGEARAQAKKVLRDAALERAARAAGLRSMTYLALADMSGVEVGEDGAVTGATEALASLKAKDPTLFGDLHEGKATGKPGDKDPDGRGGEPTTRRALGASLARRARERKRNTRI